MEKASEKERIRGFTYGRPKGFQGNSGQAGGHEPSSPFGRCNDGAAESEGA
jgi:hypothetical protein